MQPLKTQNLPQEPAKHLSPSALALLDITPVLTWIYSAIATVRTVVYLPTERSTS